MAYGQKNYLEIQGINGKYRISQIGCFLVSFCNLMERFGSPVDPIDLNKHFRDRGVYVDVDDGIRDDLAWSSIRGYTELVEVTGTGSGRPPHSECIVKFNYRSGNGLFNTHFCLVADASKGLIVDSWDGQVKSWDVYGGPIAWASYRFNRPAPPTPPAPAPTPPQPAPQPPQQPEVVNITVQPGWGITHVLKAAGYSQQQYENEKEWDRVAQLNGSATRLRLKPSQVVKVYRNALPVETPPAPTPEPPKVETPQPVSPVVNPPKEAEVENPDGSVPVPVTVVPKDPNAWKKVTPEEKVYIAQASSLIKDQEGLHMDLQLVKGQKVNSAGRFTKENDKNEKVEYVITKKHLTDGKYYGIPVSLLDKGQDPDKYVGPLTNDGDDDLDNLLDDDFIMETKEALKNFTSREKLVDFLGSLYDFLIRLVTLRMFKKDKKG